MSRVCQVTGKKRMIGNNVSHSKRRTKRIFAINLKNPSEATQFEVHFGTDEHGLSASNVFHLDIEGGMDTFKTFYCYIPTQNEKWVNILNAPGGLSEQETGSYTAPEMEEGGSFWEGYLNSLRIDGVYFGGRSGLVPGGTSYDIAWIAFFKTEDDVKNFAGPDRTKPTPEPTPTPDISTIAPFGTIIFDSDDYDDFWTGANLIDDVRAATPSSPWLSVRTSLWKKWTRSSSTLIKSCRSR